MLFRSRGLGLRRRVTLVFIAGALLLSATLTTFTYVSARTYLIHQREKSAERQVRAGADIISAAPPGRSVQETLDSIDFEQGSVGLVHLDGNWFVSSRTVRPTAIPGPLRDRVLEQRIPSRQWIDDERFRLVYALPLENGGAYFELHEVHILAETLSDLSAFLVGASALVTIGAMFLGMGASKAALKPLKDVSETSVSIAGGDLNRRLPGADDPDFAEFANSFNRMISSLQERMQRDARFAAMVSHELRSPVTTLRTSIDLISRRAESGRIVLDDGSKEVVEALGQAIDRFQRLVEDVIEISRTDPVDVREDIALDEVVRAVVKQNGRTIDLDLPSVSPVISGDRRRIERVVANLVENADRHGGGVKAVRVREDGDHVDLAVEDSGPGVSPADRSRIFEPFARGGNKSESIGLGLAIVSEHVRFHGGDIRVEETDSGGARFVVSLPKARS